MSTSRVPVATIDWRARVGGIQSRSTIICAGDSVYVGTCGRRWNVRDEKDGVHCLAAHSGEEHWFVPTLADVNEIALAGKDLIAPTDSGDVLVVDAQSGNIRTIVRADAAVLGKPIVYSHAGSWKAVFASVTGVIYQLEATAPKLRVLGTVTGGLRASLCSLDQEVFLASTENGHLIKIQIHDGTLISRTIAELPVTQYGGTPAITAAPLIVGDLAFVGYARETYYDEPAVACVNHRTNQLVWLAPKGETSFGNVRSTPALVDGKLVIASAYTDGVQLLNPETGRFVGEVKVGQSVFQQWSGPISVGSHHVALGRVDGVCSIVDVRHQKLVSSISLATAEIEPVIPVGQGRQGSQAFVLYPGQPAPAGAICGTPTFDGHRLLIGTTDGNFAAIRVELIQ